MRVEPRVAFFPDSFAEVNGVAHTSRQLVAFAEQRNLPLLCVHGGGRPTHLMRRGVDTSLFSPVKRVRGDGAFLIGYVGRLSPEKNVRRLVELERGLIEAGAGDFRFLIVGCGSEREWLERRMRRAEFTGILRGEALARAYASLDLFVFPSQTDTFGNVVLEAQASGVPCLVSSRGGPRSIIQAGADTCASGMVADTPRAWLPP